MTVSRIKVRLPTRFPSSVSAASPIILNRAGGAFAFSLDIDEVFESLNTDNLTTGAQTGTGSLVRATSPTLVNASISGATITGATLNGNTWTPGDGIFTIATGKSLGVSNILGLSGTDGANIQFGAGGTVAYTGNKLSAFAATTSLELKGTISDETGSGSLVFANTPTLVTPVLGAATATSINGATVSPGHHSGEPSNGSAVAGEIGEHISSSVAVGSAVSLTTGTPANITSISLTAGDWDISGVAILRTNAATTLTLHYASINTTSATHDLNTPGKFCYQTYYGTAVGATIDPTLAMPTTRVSIASPTTFYLVTTATFATNVAAAWGLLRARRIR